MIEEGFAVAALRAADLHGAASRWLVDEDGGQGLRWKSTTTAPLSARISLSMKCGQEVGAKSGTGCFADIRTPASHPYMLGREELKGIGRRRQLEGRPRTTDCAALAPECPLPAAGGRDDRHAKLAGQLLLPGPILQSPGTRLRTHFGPRPVPNVMQLGALR